MGFAEKLCLRWNNFESNISGAIRELREDKDFFDVTLACDDVQLQAHKVILSACSPFFRTVLRRNPHQHPLFYLKGVKYADLVAVLNFMYHGEVNVNQEELNSFLAVAEDLQVKGLAQNNIGASDNKSYKSEPTTPKPHHREPPERDPGPSSKRPRSPPSPTPCQPPSSQGDCSQSFHNSDDIDIQEVVPVKSEHASHTEENNTAEMAAPPKPPYDSVGDSGHGVVDDQGAENSMYADGDYEDYEQYESKAAGSFYVSMMGAGKVGSASADSNKELDQMIEEKMSRIYSDSGCKTMWKCDICGKASNRKSHIIDHVESHFEGAFQPCPHCNKMLKTRKSLGNHIRAFHMKKEMQEDDMY